MEASVIIQKCSKSNQFFGVRIQKTPNGDWVRTWAFPVKESYGKTEGFDKNNICGSMFATEEYPGCPYCEAYGFVQCGKCNKISCWDGEESPTCPWCGTVMRNIVKGEKFDVLGESF